MTAEAGSGAERGRRAGRPRPSASSVAWTAVPLLVALFVAVPVLCLPLLAAFPEENIWPHLAATVLPRYVTTTLELMLGVAVGTLAIGVSSAWLVTVCDFPGRRYFEWLLLLPLAMPAYVIAYVYTDLLEYSGPLQGALRSLFGWEDANAYWFPEIRSLGGAVAMMSLVFYPYVYLLARSAFLEQSVAALEASRTLGCSAWGAFFRVVLPGARPAIAVGLALALMETLNDFGTVDFFGVQTMTAGIYDVWLNMSNLGGAAQIAVVMLSFVAVLLFIERASRRRQRHHTVRSARHPLPEYRLRPLAAAGAAGLCATVVGLGFVIPASVLAYYAAGHADSAWTPDFARFASASLALASAAAVLTVTAGMLLAYGLRLRGGLGMRATVRTASLGYAVPGAVLAIGVLVPFTTLDNVVDGVARAWFGVSTGLLLSGSAFMLLFAYTVRFLAVPAGGIESSLARVTPSMDMAARTLGYSPAHAFLRVHLPLIRGGMLAAGTVVFVDCMKELPATLILRPFNFDTLATHVYQFASDEQIELAALGALAIVVVGLAPVAFLSRSLRRTRGSARAGTAGVLVEPVPS